jgi:hypothetical protein
MPPHHRHQHATAEQLRNDINRGLTGDKIPARDPAAAPLGADDEAAGMPPSSEEIDDARRREAIGRSPDTSNAQDPARGADPHGRDWGTVAVIILLIALIGLLGLSAWFYA